MKVKAVIQFFVFGFLLLGTCANSLEDKAHSIPINPSLNSHISKLHARTRNERMLFPYYTQPANSRSFPQNDFVTDPESLDINSLPQMDAIYPTFDPSSPPATTTPTNNPTPDMNNPTTNPPQTTNPTTNPTTSPVTNPTTNPPTNPTTNPPTNPTTNPPTNPAMGGGGGGGPATSSSGKSWCVASQSASENVLQVGLDYACGYGGADCSSIQQGGPCFNPDTVHDHASVAFNSYYQKNPVPTSCDFGGAAVLTNTDPSTSTCQYPSSSPSSTTTTPTMGTPSGPTGFGQAPPFDNSPPTFGTSPPSSFGSSPPDDSDSSPSSITLPSSFASICFITSLVYFKVLRP